MIFPGKYVIWFSRNPERPWRVRTASGQVIEVSSVETLGPARTEVSDTGFAELPDGPRGVFVAIAVSVASPQELIGP